MGLDAPRRFVVLDSWRGIAALLVVFYHCRYVSHFQHLPLVQHAWLAVDFFFVLSGFVLGHAYGGAIASTREFRAFVIRRTGRLWPLHVFMLAVIAAPWVRGQLVRWLAGVPLVDTGENNLYSIFTNVLLVHSLGVHHGFTWNAPSWSISTEYYTNVLFGLVVLRWRRLLPGVALLLIVVSVSVVIAFADDGMGTAIDFGMFRCVYGFFTGTLVHLLFRRLPPMPAVRPGAATAIEAGAVALAGAFVWHASLGSTLSLFAPIVFGVVVLVFLFEAGLVSRVLQRRPFVTLGALSYSIYMTHAFLYSLVIRAYEALQPPLPRTAWTLARDGHLEGHPWVADAVTMATVALVIGVSTLTYRFIELPWRTRFNRAARAVEAPVRPVAVV